MDHVHFFYELADGKSFVHLSRGMAFPPSTSTFLNLCNSQEGFRILIVLSSVAISLSQSLPQLYRRIIRHIRE